LDYLYFNYTAIWHCNNPSGKLRTIKKHIKKYLGDSPLEYDSVGNMYVGDFSQPKPCLVAHLDSVHASVGRVFFDGNKLSSSNGIGGDDKCGIIAGLELFKRCNINLLLTVDEEIGGVGANAVDVTKLEKTLYFIEIDRKGSSDFITNLIWSGSVTPEFMAEVTPYLKGFKFKEEHGTYTDLCDIIPEIKVCGVNLSAGYYNPHTKKEYVLLNELQNTLDFAEAICNNLTDRFPLPEFYFDELTLDYEDYERADFEQDMIDIETIGELLEYSATMRPPREFTPELIARAYQLGLDERNSINELMEIDNLN
jgi:hypothetical protein